ncbi:MAG: histone deacetylase family protein [Bacteroidota bacterium]|nr:histone deacetylase family protein [Bacteroidota bacterium]
MKILFNKKFLKHNPDSLFEGSYRIKDFQDIEDTEANGEEYLQLIHTEDYIRKFKYLCNKNDYLAEVRLSKDSWDAALTAVGLSVLASEQGDFAAVRPPGHHAYPDRSEGFCFFNNIAIAAQRLVEQGKKVLIIDIDAHHGNGIQEIFYKTDRVMYASIHQMYTFPMSGFPEQSGEGAGAGYTLNYPLMLNCGDKEFMEALNKVLVRGNGFEPDVVGVAVGFDGYHEDRMLNLNYSENLFFNIGFKIRRNFGHVFAVLEGGYHEHIRKLSGHFIEGVNKGAKPPKIQWDENMAIG